MAGIVYDDGDTCRPIDGPGDWPAHDRRAPEPPLPAPVPPVPPAEIYARLVAALQEAEIPPDEWSAYVRLPAEYLPAPPAPRDEEPPPYVVQHIGSHPQEPIWRVHQAGQPSALVGYNTRMDWWICGLCGVPDTPCRHVAVVLAQQEGH